MITDQTLPLDYEPRYFIGRRPTRLLIGTFEIPVNKWSEVARILLKDCNEKKHRQLLSVRNKISGKCRMILSDTDAGMDRALKVDEGIYFEIHCGTECLLRMLLLTFRAAGYDYSDIHVCVREKNASAQ